MTAYTSSNDSNPFDVTPSVSSGYCDEDDGSNISDGSYSAHYGAANGYHRTESNRSNSTLTNGRHGAMVSGVFMTSLLWDKICIKDT